MNKDINLDTKEGLRKGLLVVAEMLETKAIIHTDPRTKSGDNPPKPNQMNFNLQVPAVSDYDCGTVACIGGWCWLLNKEKPENYATGGPIVYHPDATERAYDFVNSTEEEAFMPVKDIGLHHLFYPPFQEYADAADKDKNDENWLLWDDLVDNYNKVTAEQAAKAIRNYLKDGNPDWHSVMTEGEVK
jgi:hypothetical protein